MKSLAPLASHVESELSCHPLDWVPLPGNIVYPPGLLLVLFKAVLLEAPGAALCLVVVDTGATDHMLPDCTPFISYKMVHNLRIQMSNNSYAPVLGEAPPQSCSTANLS